MLKNDNLNRKEDTIDILNQIQSNIRLELDSIGIHLNFKKIESEPMIDQYIQLKNSIQDEITKKFEASKYVSKIKEIFEKNFELLTDYFVRCQKHTETSKYIIYLKLNQMYIIY